MKQKTTRKINIRKPRQIFAAALLVSLIFGGWYGWRAYSQNQKRARASGDVYALSGGNFTRTTITPTDPLNFQSYALSVDISNSISSGVGTGTGNDTGNWLLFNLQNNSRKITYYYWRDCANSDSINFDSYTTTSSLRLSDSAACGTPDQILPIANKASQDGGTAIYYGKNNSKTFSYQIPSTGQMIYHPVALAEITVISSGQSASLARYIGHETFTIDSNSSNSASGDFTATGWNAPNSPQDAKIAADGQVDGIYIPNLANGQKQITLKVANVPYTGTPPENYRYYIWWNCGPNLSVVDAAQFQTMDVGNYLNKSGGGGADQMLVVSSSTANAGYLPEVSFPHDYQAGYYTPAVFVTPENASTKLFASRIDIGLRPLIYWEIQPSASSNSTSIFNSGEAINFDWQISGLVGVGGTSGWSCYENINGSNGVDTLSGSGTRILEKTTVDLKKTVRMWCVPPLSRSRITGGGIFTDNDTSGTVHEVTIKAAPTGPGIDSFSVGKCTNNNCDSQDSSLTTVTKGSLVRVDWSTTNTEGTAPCSVSASGSAQFQQTMATPITEGSLPASSSGTVIAYKVSAPTLFTLTCKGSSNTTASDTRTIYIVDNSTTLAPDGGGNCSFGGNNQISATTFCLQTFSVASDNASSTFTGSFVAAKFNIRTGSKTRFYDDFNLSRKYPPGFKYLQIPIPKEVGQ